MKKNNLNKGDSTIINNLPLFSILSNIEDKPIKGGNLCRSAGVGGLLISKDNNVGVLKLNSG
jgi:large subunit ribosomal protein L2